MDVQEKYPATVLSYHKIIIVIIKIDQQGVTPGISKMYLIKWPVSVYSNKVGNGGLLHFWL